MGSATSKLAGAPAEGRLQRKAGLSCCHPFSMEITGKGTIQTPHSPRLPDFLITFNTLRPHELTSSPHPVPVPVRWHCRLYPSSFHPTHRHPSALQGPGEPLALVLQRLSCSLYSQVLCALDPSSCQVISTSAVIPDRSKITSFQTLLLPCSASFMQDSLKPVPKPPLSTRL